MRKLLVFFSMMAIAAVLSVNLTSCGDDPIPAPTVKLLADIDPDDQYTVNLTVDATDVETISWDYGDGNISVGGMNHSYKYAESGEYVVTVTVTNASGTAVATADAEINASIQEMLAGVDPAGKIWVMNRTPAANDGAGPLHPSEFNITLPFALVPDGDALAYVGFPDEYDNEFTFKPDGGFDVDGVNGWNLSTQIYAFIASGQTPPGNGWNQGDLGFATISFTPEANASWTVDEDATIAMDVMSDDPATPSEYTPMSVSYEGVTQVSVSGAYFGILDMSNNVIVEKITKDEMQIVILMHTEIPDQLSIFTRITLVPKQ